MNSPTDSMSPFSEWNLLLSSGLAAREKPVPTGSMNTRSDLSSQVASLSTRWNGGAGIVGSAGAGTRRGPRAPMCSQSDAEPGPPLKLNRSGRDSVAFTSSRVWAMKKIRASTSPFASLIGIRPAVVVYLSSCPPTRTVWCVITGSSSVELLDVSFFSFACSPVLVLAAAGWFAGLALVCAGGGSWAVLKVKKTDVTIKDANTVRVRNISKLPRQTNMQQGIPESSQ